jgi:hypothetical protein
VNLALISCFRNSASRGELDPYLIRLDRLCRTLDSREYTLRLLAVEGDSTDATRELLLLAKDDLEDRHWHFDMDVLDGAHGGYLPQAGDASTRRMRQFAKTAQVGYNAVRPDDDFVINVESDLRWAPLDLLQLIATLKNRPDIDIIAPAVYCGARFYDTWAFRFPGEQAFSFDPYPPVHPSLDMERPTELASVGSCVVMRGDVARACRMAHDDAVVGFCREARERGYRVWTDFRVSIFHPSERPA